MRSAGLVTLLTIALVAGAPAVVAAQEPTREGAIEQEQREKSQRLTPQLPNKGEQLVARVETHLTTGAMKWYPFFNSAAQGGGFTLGAGYRWFVSPYNTLAVQGSYTVLDYKRLEAVFLAPHLFKRRGVLTLVGGWREATQVGFWGIGMDTGNSEDARVNYGFKQPYTSANLTYRPTRKNLLFDGGVEWVRWNLQPGEDTFPSIETKYPASVLPGIDDTTNYLHTLGTVGFDWRPAAGYARRGGFYGITVHDFHHPDETLGFNQVDYEAIQHLPILRETWVLSLHGRASTTYDKDGQHIPFYALPSLGGGSTLRAYSSWRYRDHNSLLLQAEWRIMVCRFLDTAFFYDAGKVASSPGGLDLNGLKDDFGFGVRFHGPFTTPLRIELAKGQQGISVVFASSAAF